MEQKIFDKILSQFNSTENSPLDLLFDSSLSDEQLTTLTQYINTNKDKFKFAHLSLCISKDMLTSQSYHALFLALKKTAIQKLDLAFSLNELQTSAGDIAALLNQNVINKINYPVVICEQSSPIKQYKNKDFSAFYADVVTKVQTYNKAKLNGAAIDEQPIEQDRVIIAREGDNKIKLKELIARAQSSSENLDRYIKLEVQHTEVEQQEQVQEEVMNIAVQEQEQEQALFDGKLIDFASFSNEPYRGLVKSDSLFNAFKYELFGNMPKAIKFLSHEAAMKIAANAGSFVALNADNLPQNFILKKTPKGELVLDYNQDADEQKTNEFTPKAVMHYGAAELIYDSVDLPEDIKKIAQKYSINTSSKQLDNLWVRYGDEGVKLLFDAFGEPGEVSNFIIKKYLNRFPHWDRLLDDKRFLHALEKIKQYKPAELICLTEFLSYTDDITQFDLTDLLRGFDKFWSEWSTLAEKNKLDLNAINGSWSHKKVGNPLVYMERLLTILKNSRDLSEQLTCLDGVNLVLRLIPENIKLEDYKRNFDSDKPCCSLLKQGSYFYLYGNKADGSGWGFTKLDANIVAAEKLVFPVIDKNLPGTDTKDKWAWFDARSAQSFDSKHQNLYKHIDAQGAHSEFNHSLDNYGAYYASKYEGFNLIAKEMSLHYDPDKQNTATFNPNSAVYRAELDKLVEYCAENKLEQYYNAGRYDEILKIFREKITYEQIIERVYRFIGQQPKGIPLAVYAYGVRNALRNYRCDLGNTIVTSLFFVAHERYTGDVDVYELLSKIERMECHTEVVLETNRSLMHLFKQDIRLSDTEGYAISCRVGLLNSAETDHFDKAHYIQKLFAHLQNNKYGTLKAIRHLAKEPESKWPFVYALDTAEYLMQDTNIAGHYHSDLLLFSTLINYKYEEVYFEGRKDTNAAQIKQNLQQVREILHKAATNPEPNNLDYAIKAIVQSGKYFTYENFLKVCKEIDKLTIFDNKEVEKLLTTHKFILNVAMPEVFSRDSGAVKGIMTMLLLALEMAEGDSISLVPIVDASDLEISNVNFNIEKFNELAEKQKQKLELQKQLLSNPAMQNEINKITDLIEKLKKELSGISMDELTAKQKQLQQQREKYQRMLQKSAELNQLNMKDLQRRLNDVWKTKGMMLSLSAKVILRPALLQLKNHIINEEFRVLGASLFVTQLTEKICVLPSFKDADDFEKIDHIANEANALAKQFKLIMNCNYFRTNEKVLTQIFSKIDYAGYDYETLFALLNMLVNMLERDYAEVLSAYIDISHKYAISEKMLLMQYIERLHNENLPSDYIAKFISLLPNIDSKDAKSFFMQQIIAAFNRDADDPLLSWIMKTDKVKVPFLLIISNLTYDIPNNRAAINTLFAMMTDEKPILEKFITTLQQSSDETTKKIIEILAISYAATPAFLLKKSSVDYISLTNMLKDLSKENIDALYTKLRKSSIAITCLNDGLKNRNKAQPFNDFINEFEKAPFGERNFTAQFDTEHVERVVNSFVDLNNQTAYTYAYRKQMMEAFLFVNRAGNDLPVYNNKPAKDLSNDEIALLFTKIKLGAFKHLDPFQTRLYALGLMREAMYRTTGQFPYSTQMITLIDCIMHKGDVISNIDTGQGKSMIDTMKATLLWLESGRVDLTTSSLVDAKRDLDIYRPFWSMLNVPFAKTPISSISAFDVYEKQGINVGTMAQFALFYSKAKGEQVDLESEHVSLVMNESDYTILDDKTVYRYAATGGPGLIGAGKEWIYDDINKFVLNPDFKANTTSKEQDIANLKNHLLKQAKLRKKSPTFIENFSDEKLLMLLESAIIVNYRLRENFDYVLAKKPELKLINGVLCQTRSAKIIMKDGKISKDTQYGNGMQQLLYSNLNKIHGDDSFVIEPESTTIMSSNNKNMIDYYRSKKGFIWGSSGTVGFGQEIDLQYKKYGFEFSKVEPHQRNITKLSKPVISSDENAQFKHIIKLLKPGKTSNKYIAPALVIFKDIETATRFYTYLKNKYKDQAMQLYTGLGNEEETIQNAAKSGMITITTPALGRNTDIHYDKSVGMNVIETFVASAREDRQKAGRTGRQGSVGNVYYSLNKEDLGTKTIDEVRAILAEKAEAERQFNEELYDILGGLLAHIGKADKAFFKEKWSKFSEGVEYKYRAEKLNETYKRDQFLQGIVTQFNKLHDKPILLGQLNKNIDKRRIKAKAVLDKKDVMLADCIVPDIIAYHFVNLTTSENVSLCRSEMITTKLNELFSNVNTKKFTASNNDYISYLNMNSSSKDVIKKAHEDFLSEYLTKQISQSTTTTFYKRWLGFEGHLNKIVNNSNYLLLFKAMIDVSASNTNAVSFDINQIKDSIATLLEEYTQYSWFTNSSRRKAAKDLIHKINLATTIDDIVVLLSKTILDVMDQDIKINQNSFWRKIKPLNTTGDSRLQNTLGNALKLASVLGSKTIDDKFIQNLEQQSRSHDKTTAKVATKSLDSASKHNSFNKSIDGMKGREHESDDDTDTPRRNNSN